MFTINELIAYFILIPIMVIMVSYEIFDTIRYHIRKRKRYNNKVDKYPGKL